MPQKDANRAGNLAVGGLEGVGVLCIDNEDVILRGMQSLLSGWGCRVWVARTASEALLTLGEQQPQLVVVDYHLDRDVTGLQALQALTKHWQRQVPGILVSADISEEVRGGAAQAGLYYLAKPVKPAALRNLLRRLARQAVPEKE